MKSKRNRKYSSGIFSVKKKKSPIILKFKLPFKMARFDCSCVRTLRIIFPKHLLPGRPLRQDKDDE